MNNVHIWSGHPISNWACEAIFTPSALSHMISLHIKLWISEWPIVACCCCDIFGYIKFFSSEHLVLESIQATFLSSKKVSKYFSSTKKHFFIIFSLFLIKTSQKIYKNKTMLYFDIFFQLYRKPDNLMFEFYKCNKIFHWKVELWVNIKLPVLNPYSRTVRNEPF